MPPNTNPFRSLGWTDEEWWEFLEKYTPIEAPEDLTITEEEIAERGTIPEPSPPVENPVLEKFLSNYIEGLSLIHI